MAKILELMQLSPTMKTGTFVRWIKKPGDAVNSDTIIAEIETDKAVMEMMAFDEGILLATLVEGGEQIPVGTPIAIIGEIGEDISDLLEQAKKRLNEIKSGTTTTSKESTKENNKKEDIKIQETTIDTTKQEANIEESPIIKSPIIEEQVTIQESNIKPSTNIILEEPSFKPEKTLQQSIEVEISDIQKPIINRPSLNGNISIPPYVSLAKSFYRTKYPISPLAKKNCRKLWN